VARAPDTGCTRCDLDECLKAFVAAFRRMPPGVPGPLFADCAGDHEVRAAFRERERRQRRGYGRRYGALAGGDEVAGRHPAMGLAVSRRPATA
jgi:Tetracyclin repressor-like, C-terminal domain